MVINLELTFCSITKECIAYAFIHHQQAFIKQCSLAMQSNSLHLLLKINNTLFAMHCELCQLKFCINSLFGCCVYALSVQAIKNLNHACMFLNDIQIAYWTSYESCLKFIYWMLHKVNSKESTFMVHSMNFSLFIIFTVKNALTTSHCHLTCNQLLLVYAHMSLFAFHNPHHLAPLCFEHIAINFACMCVYTTATFRNEINVVNSVHKWVHERNFL